MDVAADLTLAGDARGALRRLGGGLASDELRGVLDVAVGLFECLTTVEHARARELSELLELLHGDRRHGRVLLVNGWDAKRPILALGQGWGVGFHTPGGEVVV